jgi:hypothetical protein
MARRRGNRTKIIQSVFRLQPLCRAVKLCTYCLETEIDEQILQTQKIKADGKYTFRPPFFPKKRIYGAS